MHTVHKLLVTAYLVTGLTMTALTPWSHLAGSILSSGGATLQVETLHGAAADETTMLPDPFEAMQRARAAKQLMIGVLLFTLGGFVHAYAVLRSERPVHITVIKKKPRLLYWLTIKM